MSDTATALPLLLSVRQAAELMGISHTHAYNLINAGDWPVPNSIRLIRGRPKVSRVQLERWIETGEVI